MTQQLAKDAAQTEKELRWALFRSVVEGSPVPQPERLPSRPEANQTREVQR